MPERVRFFVWRRSGKAVAFGECIVHGDTMYAEYLGLDYSVALRLHLYHYVFRDLVKWGIATFNYPQFLRRSRRPTRYR
jgi:hypothetical protein